MDDIEKLVGCKPYGFVYNIVAENGREYIGQKQLTSTRTKKASKRQLEKLGKSHFRRKKSKVKGEWVYYESVTKESNWLGYTGSNAELNNDIKKNGVNVTKYILAFAVDKTSLTYLEVKHIICTGALEDPRFYNDNVLGKFYKKRITKAL